MEIIMKAKQCKKCGQFFDDNGFDVYPNADEQASWDIEESICIACLDLQIRKELKKVIDKCSNKMFEFVELSKSIKPNTYKLAYRINEKTTIIEEITI